MEELIPITTQNFNGHETLACDSRDLHSFLEVETRHNDWIVRRIEKYGFTEGIDFIHYSNLSNPSDRTIFYRLSISMAKELAMVENNDKGAEVRRYIIEYERIAKDAMEMELEINRRVSAEKSASPNLNDVIHMGSAIDYSRTLRQMARLKNYSPTQRLAFLAEAASVLSGRPADQFLPESFDPADAPETIIYTHRESKIRQDALNLAALIGDREREGLPRLPVSKAGQLLFGWGHGRTDAATEYAIKNDLLIAVKKLDGKGWILASPARQKNDPAGNSSSRQA